MADGREGTEGRETTEGDPTRGTGPVAEGHAPVRRPPAAPEEEGSGAGASRPPEQPGEPGRETRFVRLGLLFYGALAVAAIVWRIGIYREPIFFLDAESAASGVRIGRDLGLGVGSALAVIAASDWMTRRTGWGEDLARAMGQALGTLSTPNAVLLAVASGFAEELFFRGALQPRVGLVLASLLFGCVHFVPQRTFLPWTGFAIVAGFLFGGLFLYTGNLLAPIVAHAVVNGVNLPLLVKRYGADPPRAAD